MRTGYDSLFLSPPDPEEDERRASKRQAELEALDPEELEQSRAEAWLERNEP